MATLALLFAVISAVEAYTVVDSGFVMRKNIDPIVLPGLYESHMHSFFGADAVTVNTTTSAELQAGCHANGNPNDFSVYWTPTLFAVSGEERIPIEARYFKAYYVGIESAEIAIPQDFKAVAGNAKATSQADVEELAGISWFCEYGPEGAAKDPAAFPTETCEIGRLQSLLLFHDCVNPDTLESAYSGRHNLPRENRCPEGMQRIPQLRFSVRFAVDEAVPEGWSGEAPFELASGPSYSWHGDFINAWLPEAAENMLLANDKREFAAVEGPLREMPDCTVQDPDPDNGTSDYEESLQFLGGSSSASDDEDVEAVALPTSAEATTPTTLATIVSSSATAASSSAMPTSEPDCTRRQSKKMRRRHH